VSGIYRHIGTSSQQGVTVISVELAEVKDYMVAEELRYELVDCVKRSASNKFVLDLSKMSFMTSLACVAFIGLKHAIRENHGALILCHISDFIRKIFDAKRLLTPAQNTGNVAFEDAQTLEDAIARLTR
jgi:anti-anti-sigma factor